MKSRRRNLLHRNAPTITGVAWYKPEQYVRMRELSTDKESMHKTYEEWRAGAETFIVESLANGLVLKKVDVDLDDMLAWCRLHGKDFNGAARSEYVAHKLKQRP